VALASGDLSERRGGRRRYSFVVRPRRVRRDGGAWASPAPQAGQFGRPPAVWSWPGWAPRADQACPRHSWAARRRSIRIEW